ncbi:conjugal transfer protein [Dietzia sp. ANT_WB102]|nr:conjugal transfer protein [Dietzia sp. ANT_WB102]
MNNPSPRGGRTGLTVVAVIAALSLIAALVAGGLWLSERGEAGSVRAERASATELNTAYRDFAKEVMTDLMTIRQDTLKEDVDKIVSKIEGDFSEQFAPRRDSYEEVVKTTKVAAEGTVSAAAVEKADNEQAQVIMAIDQTIANPRSEKGQDRQYRIRVTVNRHDDGGMKVSGVNFIP